MSQFTVEVRDGAFLSRIRGLGERFRAAMVRTVTRLSILVQGDVKSKKLTGQVLHVRSGTLRRSINRKVVDDGVNVIATVGTNVSYAAIHEYGFVGPVNVREHARKSRSGKVTNVRAHVRQLKLPSRSFLRSTLKNDSPVIREEILMAAAEALRS